MKLLLDMNVTQRWDLDFGDLLAAAATSEALEQGALVSVDLKNARVRLLPLRAR